MNEQQMKDELDLLRAANATLWSENKRLLRLMKATHAGALAARLDYISVMVHTEEGYSYNRAYKELGITSDQARLDMKAWREANPDVKLVRDYYKHTYKVDDGHRND